MSVSMRIDGARTVPASLARQRASTARDQEALPQVQQLEVGQYLRLVQGQQAVHALDFDQGGPGDDEVRAIAAGDVYAFVVDRNRHLSFERDPRLSSS